MKQTIALLTILSITVASAQEAPKPNQPSVTHPAPTPAPVMHSYPAAPAPAPAANAAPTPPPAANAAPTPPPAANAAPTPPPTPAPAMLTQQDFSMLQQYVAGSTLQLKQPDGSMHPLVDGTQLLGFIQMKFQEAAAKEAKPGEKTEEPKK